MNNANIRLVSMKTMSTVWSENNKTDTETHALLYNEKVTPTPYIIGLFYDKNTHTWGSGEYYKTENKALERWDKLLGRTVVFEEVK